ncbi:MAG: transglutaminase-like domain-containing protein [Candidatus Limivicinus sp.]|nr:transglutaminase-like domain-containing protein [Clostridiales bacterium]MDY6133082.1 transglutaminase-like domain-containing protein [Candidatus Limivicinus sp.]
MKNRFLNRFVNLVLLILCILPLAALIADSFALITDKRFMLWAAGICLLMWLAANFRHGFFPGFLLSALLLYLAYRFYHADLRLELTDFFDRLTGVYYEHYYAIGSKYPYAAAVDSHSFILLLAVFLLSAYVSMSLTSKSGRTVFSLLGSLPVFAGCIAVNGRPSVFVIVCLMLFWAMLLIGGNYYGEESNQGRTLSILALPLAALLCALVLWQKPAEYDYNAQPTDMVEKFDRLGSAFSSWINSREGGLNLFPGETAQQSGTSSAESDNSPIRFPGVSWGMGDGALSLNSSASAQDREKLILRVRAETDGYMYLRCFSYGDYTGTGWRRAEEPENGISSLDFTALALAAKADSARHSLDIRFSSGVDVAAVPYYSVQSADSDIYVPAEGRNYSASYYSSDGSWDSLSLPEEYAQDELSYRSYATTEYTALPEGTKANVLQLIQQAGLRADSPDIIAEVASYVRSCVSYDLDTQPYPTEDYAVYFLQNAETGYCVHYATAAAVIYRALGIPARVTDGFLFRAQAGEVVDVLQANEHAWVEVYLDGLGWIPVEVTGSGGVTEPAPQEAAVTETPGEETPPPLESTEPNDGEESAPPLQTPQPSDTIPVGPIRAQTDPESKSTSRTLIRFWNALTLILLLGAIFSLLPVSRLMRLRLRQRRISQPDRKKAAVWVWRTAVKASRYGAEVPESITACAEKAAFSQHGISDEELHAVQNELKQMLDDCYNGLSPVKSFIFKFFSALK